MNNPKINSHQEESEMPCEGDLLVVRRMLSNLSKVYLVI